MGNILNHLPDSKRVPRQKDKINKFFFQFFDMTLLFDDLETITYQ
jgi:hypothetical protein